MIPDQVSKNSFDTLEKTKRNQMLKLVTKGFYSELMNYGVKGHEVVTISTNLLDELIHYSQGDKTQDYYSSELHVNKVKNNWVNSSCLSLEEVIIKPLEANQLADLEDWLCDSWVDKSIIALYPKSERKLATYFEAVNRFYFGIYYQEKFVGIIGGENVDHDSKKLEMRKFVGDKNMRGKGIGKRATFLFLYWCFLIKNLNKVYLHTCDINIKNINLNSKMGFVLEGVLIQDLILNSQIQDVVRMSLLRSQWLTLFE